MERTKKTFSGRVVSDKQIKQLQYLSNLTKYILYTVNELNIQKNMQLMTN